MSLSKLEPGRVLAGTYEVALRADRGASTPVYFVKHLPTGTARVLKLLPPELLEHGLDRLRREALLDLHVKSPRIVAVEDVGVDEGTPWIVMEMLVGHDLGFILDEPRTPELPEVRAILVGLGEALREAHRAGVCHGDLRPEALHGRFGFLYLEHAAADLGTAERDRLGRAASETLAAYAPLWQRLTSRVVDGRTSEGFLLEHVRELGWLESTEYRALALTTIERAVQAPLGRFGIRVTLP